MIKVNELININFAETVIKFSNKYSVNSESENLINNFVITGDVLTNLKKFVTALSENYGCGFFLKGSYGSGKSHFLSVLSLILQYQEFYKKIFSGKNHLSFADKLNNKKYLVINLPLVLYSSKNTLETLLLSAIEDKLSELQIDLPLSEEQNIVNDFFGFVSDKVKQQFYEFLELKNIDFKNSSVLLQAKQIKKFVIQTDVPFKIRYNREKVFNSLFDMIKEQNYSGIVILIDELSEFLRSKLTKNLLDEDTRFLQYIGEKSQNNSLWILGAVQEDINEITAISDNIFRKIKDRFKYRLTLTTQHIEEIIEKRLIKKKSGSEKLLDKCYTEFIKSFPYAIVDKERFIKIYPLTNPTLLILDSITGIFSKQRGIIDFIYYQIKGDSKRGITGILNKDYQTYITPDKIFDHFENTIQEYDETNSYYDVVYKYYIKNIPKFFKEQKEQQLAFKLIKLLILVEIAPILNSQKIKSIVNMLMYKFSDIDYELNYEYIYENIIKVFINKMNFVEEIKKQNYLDNIIRINFKINVNKIINNKLSLVFKQIDNNLDNVIENVVTQFNLNILPIADLYNKEIVQPVIFKNSERKGIVTLKKISDLNEGTIFRNYGLLNQKDYYYYLIVIFPETDKFSEIKHTLFDGFKDKTKSFIFWIPDKLSKNVLNKIKYYYAYTKIYSEYTTDNSENANKIKQKLNFELSDLKEYLKNELIKVFANGKFYTNETELDVSNNFVYINGFTDILTVLVKQLLEKLYPDFDKIKPLVSDYNINDLNKTIRYFFKEGVIGFTQAQNLKILHILEGILMPLKICKRKSNNFYFKINLNKSEFLLDIVSQVNDNSVNLNDLYLKYRNSNYGITKQLFYFFVYALIFGGYLQAKKNNRKLNHEYLRLDDYNSIDEIYVGALINEDLQKKLLSLNNVIKKSYINDMFTFDIQNKIWENLCEIKRENLEKFKGLETKLYNLQNYSVFNKYYTDIKIRLKNVIEKLDNIKVTYSSSEGIENFLNSIDNVYIWQSDFLFVKNLYNFLYKNFQEYIFIFQYIKQSIIPENYKELNFVKSELLNQLVNFDIILDAGSFSEFKNSFLDWQTDYINIYIEKHNDFYNKSDKLKLDEIKKSVNYEILEKISSIKLLGIENDINTINFVLNNYDKQICSGIRRDKLIAIPPICNCGYKLGDESIKFDFVSIKEKINNGILEFINRIKEHVFSEKIMSYNQGLKKLGKNDVTEKIDKLLSLNSKEEFSKLITLLKFNLNFEIIQHLKKAVTGEVVVVERNIDSFINKITNKNLHKDRLIKLFYNWLSDNNQIDLNRDVFINIKSGTKNSAQTDLAAKYFPDISNDKINKYLILINWLNTYNFESVKYFKLVTGEKNSLTEYEFDKLLQISEQLNYEINENEFDEFFGNMLGLIDFENNSLEKLITYLNNEKYFNKIKYKLIKNICIRIYNSDDITAIEKIVSQISIDNDTKVIFSLYKLISTERKMKIFFKHIDLKNWIENVFLQHLSDLQLHFDRVIQFQNKIKVLPDSLFYQLFDKIQNLFNECDKHFKNLNQKFVGLKTLDKFKINFVKNKKKYIVLLIDCLRYDLLDFLVKELQINYSEIDYQISVPPLKTDVQRVALFKGKYSEDIIEKPEIFGEDVQWLNLVEFDYKFEQAQSLIENNNKIILGYNFVDNRLHSEKFNLLTFYNEIKSLFQKFVLPVIEKYKSEYQIYIISDHGFNCKFRKNYIPEYTHKTNTLNEIITPVLLL